MSPAKSIPLSVRLSQDEADFIARFNSDDAVTPSEKVRAIIRLARARSDRPSSYAGALRLARELLTPAIDEISHAQNEIHQRSELLAIMNEWLPDMVAFVLATQIGDKTTKEDLLKTEEGLAERCFRLMEALLRLGVTERAPCFNPNVIRDHADHIVELSSMIDPTKKQKKEA